MKRKLFILGTLGLAGLFAGGVVAAYTIADNADKQSIKISPGSITEDKVGKVTLAWGESTNFGNVENLKAGTPVTRTVNVKATVENEQAVVQASEVYAGRLDVELVDLSGKTGSAKKLIDYLHVDIMGYSYDSTDGFAENKTKQGEIPTSGENAFVTYVDLYSDKDGKDVDFVISLDSSATPFMSQILTDQVRLTVDWNRGDAETGMKHVYIPDNGWSAMYVYSYTAAGVENAGWPGVQLTKNVSNGMYEADLNDNHELFIFNDGGSNQYPATGGMDKTSLNYNTAAAVYFDWSTHAFTSTEPVQLAPFYLVGDPDWDMKAAFAFELHDEDKGEAIHQYFLKATVVANNEYKFREGTDVNTRWAGYNEVEYNEQQPTQSRALITDAGGNFKFNTAGTYDIYLKVYSDHISVWIATAA